MKKKGKEIAVRPDTVVESRYTLTTVENDLVDILLSEIDDDDVENLRYTLDLTKYKRIFPVGKSQNIYKYMKEAVEQLYEKSFYLHSENPEDNGLKFRWLSGFGYNKRQGSLWVEVGASLKEILVAMKRGVFYNIKYSLSLNSNYSKRIYYMMKQYQDTGVRWDRVDDLRTKLECPVSYEKYGLFAQKVLSVAKKEINEKTDIIIDYTPIYEKNKVVRLQFTIKENTAVINKESKEETVTNVGLSKDHFEELKRYALGMLGDDHKEYVEEYVNWASETVDPAKIKKNKKAYVRKVIENKDTVDAFCTNIQKKKTKAKNLIELEMAEEQFLKEKEELLQKAMEEKDVSTPEELMKSMSNLFSLNS